MQQKISKIKSNFYLRRYAVIHVIANSLEYVRSDNAASELCSLVSNEFLFWEVYKLYSNFLGLVPISVNLKFLMMILFFVYK